MKKTYINPEIAFENMDIAELLAASNPDVGYDTGAGPIDAGTVDGRDDEWNEEWWYKPDFLHPVRVGGVPLNQQQLYASHEVVAAVGVYRYYYL